MKKLLLNSLWLTAMMLTATWCFADGETLYASGHATTYTQNSEAVLYSQNSGNNGEAVISQYRSDTGDSIYIADDFEIPGGESWEITDVNVTGFYSAGAAGGTESDIFVRFYEDDAGTPGNLIAAVNGNSWTNEPEWNVTLSSPVNLNSGTYWVGVATVAVEAERWNWYELDVAAGNNPAHLIDYNDVFGAGATDWTSLPALGLAGTDMVFELEGTVGGGGGCVTEPSDDIESYTTGSMAGQSPFWPRWDNNSDWGEISTEQALSGTQSVKIEGVAAGGPVDMLYLLGDRMTGDWDVSFWLYVPSGNSAYYNIQASESPGVEWKHEFYFFSDGSGGLLTPDGAAAVNMPAYPQDTWFEVRQHIDLINDATELYVDGTMVHSWAYSSGGSTMSQIGAINFFPATNAADPNSGAIPLYYVDDVELCANPFTPPPPGNNECAGVINISNLFGGPAGSTQSSGPHDNTFATTEPSDPANGWDCWGAIAPEPELNNTLWFAFVGDGQSYDIRTSDCGGTASPYIVDGDTQMAVYTGSCGALVPADCNEDHADAVTGNYFSGFEDFQTAAGTTYFVMIDGFFFGGVPALGQYCVDVTRNPGVGIEDVTANEFGLVGVNPNPATDLIQIEMSNAQARDLTVSIMSLNGQEVYNQTATSAAGTEIIPVNVESLASGMYILRMSDENAVTNVKFVVE